jgi:CheY-like chemotaxis protein
MPTLFFADDTQDELDQMVAAASQVDQERGDLYIYSFSSLEEMMLYAEQHRVQPDIVVTDNMFAGGLRTVHMVRMLRQRLTRQFEPQIVVVTRGSKLNTAVKLLARQGGADGFMIKPLIAEEIKALLEGHTFWE